LNVFNVQKQLMNFDDVDHKPLNWISDLALREVEIDCE